jgi:hypothetical protein
MSRLVSAWHPTWKLGNCNAVLDSRVSGGVTKPRSPQLLHENDISTCGGPGKDTAKGDDPSCVVDVFCCCAVPDERVVSCADSTQNSDCPCCLAEQGPILRIPWAHSRLPSNATVMPARTQKKPPDLHLPARLAICHSACCSIGLDQLFYLQGDLSVSRLSAAIINSAASPISHHILASFS